MFTINLSNLHVHVRGLDGAQMAEMKRSFNHLEKTIMATAAENDAKFEAMATRAEKVKQEILDALANISAGTTTPAQDASIARIEAVLGGLDDLTIDVLPPVEPPEPV